MGPGDLSKALAPLPVRDDPRILVGRESFDDAGVFRISDDLALVQTVDFFAPIVDDPYAFGQIAAANALSDVYAMGGVPLTAMSIVGFPTGKLPLSVLTDILRGGQDKVHEAGAALVGGHTVTDDEVKFGLSVTGRVHPSRMLTNSAARPGDVLVLTKPLGTGLVATAVKQGSATPEHEQALVASMSQLNADSATVAVDVQARCATDITGFGLLGHASHIARASEVTLVLRASVLPRLPGVSEALANGVKTGGAERNAEFLSGVVDYGAAQPDDRALLVDPQTSGGLMVALNEGAAALYLSRVPGAVRIGYVVAQGEHLIRVEE